MQLLTINGLPVRRGTTTDELRSMIALAGRPLCMGFLAPLPADTSSRFQAQAATLLAQHAEALHEQCRLVPAAAVYAAALSAGHPHPAWCFNQQGACLGQAGMLSEAHDALTKAIAHTRAADTALLGTRSLPKRD